MLLHLFGDLQELLVQWEQILRQGGQFVRDEVAFLQQQVEATEVLRSMRKAQNPALCCRTARRCCRQADKQVLDVTPRMLPRVLDVIAMLE